MPPTEYDPTTGEDTGEMVEVGPGGAVESWAWVSHPLPKHPLQRPFAWALIRLDGADTAMLHVVDSGGPDNLASGDRVTVRFRPAAERIGAMADIESFVPRRREARPDGRGDRRRRARGPVTTLATPIRLDFDFTPGVAQSAFLRGLEQGKFMGQRCPVCGKVYVPSRGSCPTDGVPTTEDVELANSGTVTTYCVVNVPFAGQSIEIPYICAQVLLDGANLSFMGLIQEIPTDQIRMGMRVEAVWVDRDRARPRPWPRSSTSGPTASPTPTTRPTRSTCERRRAGPSGPCRSPRSPRPQNVRRDDEHNEVEMLMPVIAEVFGNIGITKDDVDFICSGSTDYLIGGPFSFVMALDAVGVWPPRAESHVEMDGAWALYEAWVLLQEGEIDAALVYSLRALVAGQPQRDPHPPARPVLPGPAVAGPGQPGRPAGPGPDRRRQGHRGGLRRHRRPQPEGRPGQSQGPGAPRTSPVEVLLEDDYVVVAAAAPRPAARSPTAPPPSCWPPGTRPRRWSESPAWITGFDHRMETHSLGRPRPDHVAVDGQGRRGGRGGRRPCRRGRDPRPLRPPGDHRAEALGLDDSVVINPSGGPLAANPLMSAGLIRIGEAADRISLGPGPPGGGPRHVGPLPPTESRLRPGG